MKINTTTVTVSGKIYTLQKYLTQVDANGNYSKFAQYSLSSATSYKDSMNAAELVATLTDVIFARYEGIPGLRSKAKKIAQKYYLRLECSNDEVEVPVRRVDPGAPKLGRPGIPTRPLVPAF